MKFLTASGAGASISGGGGGEEVYGAWVGDERLEGGEAEEKGRRWRGFTKRACAPRHAIKPSQTTSST